MCIPFTYLIGWSATKKFYYGVRWAKDSNPDRLWIDYKTSSKYVKRYFLENGDPDIIQVRKRFNTAQEARNFEERVLIRLNARDPFGPNSKWLNRTTNKSIYYETPYERTADLREQLRVKAKTRTVSEETRRKLSVIGKGRRHSEETKRKIGDGNRGKVMSPESVAKGIAARKDTTPYWLGKRRSPETSKKLSQYRAGKSYFELYDMDTALLLKEKRKNQMSKDWLITHPSGVVEQISNLKAFSAQHGLNHARMFDVANGRQKTHKGFSCKRVE